jgi:hypothetical protein
MSTVDDDLLRQICADTWLTWMADADVVSLFWWFLLFAQEGSTGSAGAIEVGAGGAVAAATAYCTASSRLICRPSVVRAVYVRSPSSFRAPDKHRSTSAWMNAIGRASMSRRRASATPASRAACWGLPWPACAPASPSRASDRPRRIAPLQAQPGVFS